jgi:hypothetical protein
MIKLHSSVQVKQSFQLPAKHLAQHILHESIVESWINDIA